MMLYRYLSEEYALQVLQTRKWKVGRLLELNDPADCQPTLTGAPQQQNEEAAVEFARKYFSKVYEDVGVICLSATITDPVIWSHYADAHRGIALGYDFQPSGATLREVTYQEERATLDYQMSEQLRPDGKTTDAFIEKAISYGFTRKATSWQYEKEFRIFVSLNHCQMTGSHYFLHIGTPNKVVLGIRCRTNESDILRIVKDGGLTSADVTRARMDRTKHSLSVSFAPPIQG